MESLNLKNLASSLPNSNLAHAEKDLMNNFKSAALSITTLYKSSLRTSKRAYNAGYAAACQDLLLMIQQGVSAGESSDGNGGGMSIGRIMDYVEARLEALKSREEEEDEDEEKDKDRERDRKPATTSLSRASGSLVSGVKPSQQPTNGPSRSREYIPAAPMTPLSPPTFTSGLAPGRPTSPSPSPPSSFRTIPTQLSQQRNAKSRLFNLTNAHPKETLISAATSPLSFGSPAVLSTSADAPFTIIPPPSTPTFASNPGFEGGGTKRRHATMVLESATPVIPSTPGTSCRRRTRTLRPSAQGSTRDTHLAQDQNQAQGSDVMEVEEDGGRERKRVARR
ncbi:hypothetical protein PHLCEN_2v7405 [Hermanssonia centrifuga]|uniref:Uncharacterized protein n=1 Tax=Hermanssonia centrifuga TaxID=98765 RepID=A0A2R6NWP4_9APHY|nr:hypothetical protein PHLCEN_2v7405 [Hermanssonia centrifuga]